MVIVTSMPQTPGATIRAGGVRRRSRPQPDPVDRTVSYELGEDRVRGGLDLAAVIESKEQANRDKDHAVLPVLRQTLALKTGRRQDEED